MQSRVLVLFSRYSISTQKWWGNYRLRFKNQLWVLSFDIVESFQNVQWLVKLFFFYQITDSEGRLIGVGGVSKWREITRYSLLSYSTTTVLKEFIFRVENRLSEPTKVMLFVCFANWVSFVSIYLNICNSRFI